MTKIVAWTALLGVVSLSSTGCDGFAEAMTSHTDILARAGGHELTIDEAAAMIAPQDRVAAQPQLAQVVDAVANLWVDYTLLATAAAQDSTLQNVDVDLWMQPRLQQELVWRLRGKVIQVDTAITDEELRAEWEREQTGVQVRARHILLRMPTDATQAQRDSVAALASQLRDRARGGEDFATLAQTFSADGSSSQGGDLGFFTHDQMVAPFSDAAFALQPGEISDVVETPFGLHIIKVEERKTQDFDEVKESFRMTALQRREAQAEEQYITGLTEPLNIEVQDGAVQNAKEMASKPNMQLRGRAASRPLVRYEDGALTAAEFLDIVRASFSPEQRGQMAAATDDQIKQVLEGLTRNEILIAQAEEEDIRFTEAEQDSVRRQVQASLAMAARQAGLVSIQPQDGETMHQAVERRVKTFLEAIMRGEQNLIPLGVIGFALREQYDGQVFDRAIDATVAKIEAQRPPAPPMPPQLPQPQQLTPPDTTGRGAGS
jgi:hypothetical protein